MLQKIEIVEQVRQLLLERVDEKVLASSARFFKKDEECLFYELKKCDILI